MKQLWLDVDLTQDVVEPSSDQKRRLRRVLRLRDGHELMVADGSGGQRLYTLQAEELVAAAPLQQRVSTAQTLHIGVGVLKGERQSWLLQKLVEAGADHIAPLHLKHCVVKLQPDRSEKRLLRWQAVVVEAFEQCGRSHLPTITAVQPLRSWLGGLPAGCRLAWCDERDEAEALQGWLQRTAAETTATETTATETTATETTADIPAVALVVGPEGGLSDEERGLLARFGGTAVHLGEAILRAETAAIVAAWVAKNTVV